VDETGNGFPARLHEGEGAVDAVQDEQAWTDLRNVQIGAK